MQPGLHSHPSCVGLGTKFSVGRQIPSFGTMIFAVSEALGHGTSATISAQGCTPGCMVCREFATFATQGLCHESWALKIFIKNMTK